MDVFTGVDMKVINMETKVPVFTIKLGAPEKDEVLKDEETILVILK